MTRHRIHLASGRSERVDRLLAESLPGLSRRRVQQLLEDGRVRIDGHFVRKGEVLVGERELDVEVNESLVKELVAEAEPAVPILFEDAVCVAFDKPAGRPGHALRSGEHGTVANFVAARFPECVAAGATPLEAGLVHRLDTETSGVLLAARTRPAWEDLRRQFRAATIGKLYLAVVSGVVRASGEIRAAIEPDPRNRRKVRVVRDGEASRRGRLAITRYRPRSSASAATLLDVEIPTGAMHQIRAHLATIGHPVVGDLLYGGEAIPGGRHLLHARRLSFDHPEDGERISVESPPPVDFTDSLRRLGLRS